MKLGVIEGYLPIERLKLGKDDGTDTQPDQGDSSGTDGEIWGCR